jgi:hypothetical protein
MFDLNGKAWLLRGMRGHDQDMRMNEIRDHHTDISMKSVYIDSGISDLEFQKASHIWPYFYHLISIIISFDF